MLMKSTTTKSALLFAGLTLLLRASPADAAGQYPAPTFRDNSLTLAELPLIPQGLMGYTGADTGTPEVIPFSGATLPTPAALSQTFCNTSVSPYVCSSYDGAQWNQAFSIDPTAHTIRYGMTLNGVARGTALGTGVSASAGPQYNPLYIFGNVTGNGDSGGFGKVVANDYAASDVDGSGNLGLGLVALDVQYIYGTGAGTANRMAVRGIVNQVSNTAAPTSIGEAEFLTGVFGQAYSSANSGGISSSYVGSFYGVSALVELQAGATYVASVQAGEFDTSVQTGASVAWRQGVSIIRVNGDAVRGAFVDCALCFTTDGTSINTGTHQSLAPWKVGVEMSRPDGYWSWGSDTDFFHAATDLTGSGSNHPLNSFINLGNIACTSACVTLPGFTVSNNGAVTGRSFTATAGGGPALTMAVNSSLEDATNGASTMYFDVSVGGTASGTFNFRTTSSFTSIGQLSASGLNVNAYSVAGTAGVSCSGVPTSSHRTINGITTVC